MLFIQITNNFLVYFYHRFSDICNERFYKPYLYYYDFMFEWSKHFKERQDLMTTLFEDVLRVQLEDLRNKNSEPCCMPYFSGLLQNNIKIEEFCEDIFSFIVVSVETSSTSLKSIMLLLATHADVQEKLYKQVSSVLNTNPDHVTEIEISQMPYLEQVIKESLRVLPIVQNIFRKTSAPLKLKNFTVPTGSNLHIRIYDLHVNEKIWGEDAKDYNPDRFEPERMTNIHSYAYVPFASGPRMCPGYKFLILSTKIMIIRLIMNYKLTTNIKFKDIKWTPSMSMKIETEPLIRFVKRT